MFTACLPSFLTGGTGLLALVCLGRAKNAPENGKDKKGGGGFGHAEGRKMERFPTKRGFQCHVALDGLNVSTLTILKPQVHDNREIVVRGSVDH